MDVLSSDQENKIRFHIIDNEYKNYEIRFQEGEEQKYKKKISCKGYQKFVFENEELRYIKFQIYKGNELYQEIELGPEKALYFLYEKELYKANNYQNNINKRIGSQEDQQSPQKSRGLILSTDLGGTLCGDQQALKSFNIYYLQNYYFVPNNYLIYNTGRGINSFYEMQKREHLLSPDWLVTRCGCGIYRNQRGVFKEDLSWKNHITTNWNADKIRESLATISSIQEKVRDDSSEDAMSLKYFITEELSEEESKAFDQTILKIESTIESQHGISFFWYIRRKTSQTTLEILPKHTDKGKSLTHIVETYLKQKIDDVIAFGDSMNDTGMLILGNRGVLVQNSNDDVKRWATENRHLYSNLQISDKSYAHALIDNISTLIQ